ncbi:MAG: MaoC family dehydratase [Acidobacteria bacterium]|nr:MaoC family dehydratase [Acidobacteriota bacterium]
MNSHTPGQQLPPYSVRGYNYAELHDNKIHSDEVAAQYGFKGGLVPGVGVYAYLTHPIVEAFGQEWLRRGAMKARFLKPIYHGEEAVVQATVQQTTVPTLGLELFNPDGTLCAVGEASIPSTLPTINPAEYPHCTLPAPEQRPLATIANLPVGMILGSLDWQLDLSALEAKFLSDVRATLPLYFGSAAVCHPAFYLAQANEILMANVKLGPWIHTGSEVQHFNLPHQKERLSLRGYVAEAVEKRGHEIVSLELGLFAEESNPIARIRHTAIVKLRDA